MILFSGAHVFIFLSWFFLAENVLCIQVLLEGQKSGYIKKKVFQGAQAQLVCTAWKTVPGKITVVWTYKRSKHEEGTGTFIARNYIQKKFHKNFSLKDQTTLIIKNPNRNNSGIYTCLLENYSDVHRSSAQGFYELLVIYPPSKPECEYPADRYLKEGHHYTIKCVSQSGSPDPRYTWFKDDVELPKNSLFSSAFKDSHFVYDEYTGILEFTKANEYNAGVYHCLASNDAGWNRSMPFKLRVLHANVELIVGTTTASLSAVLLLTIVWVCRNRVCPNYEEEIQSSNEGGNDVVLDGSGPQIVKSLPVPMSKRPKSSIII